MNRDQIAAHVGRNSELSVELVKGDGYWYFVFTKMDNAGKCVFYDTNSVMVPRKSDLSDKAWIAEGEYFLKKAEREYQDRMDF